MTLTRILPTLRRTLPEPLHRTDWPEHTRAAVDDLVVGGVSMVSLAGWCGTPCVHTGETSSVIVTRIHNGRSRDFSNRNERSRICLLSPLVKSSRSSPSTPTTLMPMPP